MSQPHIDIHIEIDKMLTPTKIADGAKANAAADRYLVLRKNLILLPPAHAVAHRERVMVPADVHDALAKRLALTASVLFQTSNTAEQIALERNTAQEQCRELAQRVSDQAKTIENLERQLFDRGRP